MTFPRSHPSYTEVDVRDRLWATRMAQNGEATAYHVLGFCEESGRLENFDEAAGKIDGEHRHYAGPRHGDSEVYKTLEGVSRVLATRDDSRLGDWLERTISRVAAAQENDGYLYTYRSLRNKSPEERIGDERWSCLEWSHELYDLGHLIEAGVAHFEATGERSLLDVAERSARLVRAEFLEAGHDDVPGHPEIELALVKLYRQTGDEAYLRLARKFIDRRGHHEGRDSYGTYSQDHVPVQEQEEAVGHAVKAAYLYTAMTDLAALDEATGYRAILERLWRDIVSRKMYLTGGIGSRHIEEDFGAPYELPNLTGYSETCASIAFAIWNHKMFLLTGDGRYVDILERVLYNAFLAGVGYGGREFFYPNPLASDGIFAFNHGSLKRQPWFHTACCPTNVVRFMPLVPEFVYANTSDALYVNLFVASAADLTVQGRRLSVEQRTGYPWDGHVEIKIDTEAPLEMELRVRIPGWSREEPVPSDLYAFREEVADTPSLYLNGERLSLDVEQGYVSIGRTWTSGDVVVLDVPMPARTVTCHPDVEENRGHVAVQRGPIVYCAESPDNAGSPSELAVGEKPRFEAFDLPDVAGGVTALRDGQLVLVPYFAWGHRGPSEMAVWLRET